MVWKCQFCDEIFKTLKELIKHIKEERENANEMALNANDDVSQCDRRLKELKSLRGQRSRIIGLIKR